MSLRALTNYLRLSGEEYSDVDLAKAGPELSPPERRRDAYMHARIVADGIISA